MAVANPPEGSEALPSQRASGDAPAATPSSALRNATALLLGVALSLATPALADQERDPQVARSLFNRARALMDDGQFAEACPMLAESQRLEPGGETVLNLALCLEGAGRLASALEQFQEARSQALTDGRDDRQRIAEERIAAIDPRLSTITVEVAETSRVGGLHVSLDGRPLSMVAWGAAVTVDGGAHRVEASAPGHEPWAAAVEVANEKDAPVIVIELVARRAAEPTTPGRKRKGPVSGAGWALIGSGLGLFVVSAGLGVGAVVIDDAAEEIAGAVGCNLARHYCPRRALADEFAAGVELAQGLGWGASIGLMLSVPLIVTGPFQRGAPVKPMVSPTQGGVLVGAELAL